MINKNNISFYRVPLVCNAVPTIGCGSRSKPVLKDLENDETINEAWLNQKGTIIAVLWNDKIDEKLRDKIIQNIFNNNKLSFISQRLTSFNDNFASFQTDKNAWLRGSDVDELSKEEASIIADQILVVYKQKGSLSAIQEKNLRKCILGKFFDFFLNFKSFNELSNTSAYRSILLDVINSSKSYLDTEQIPEINSLLKACMGHSENCTESSCCNPET